MPALEEAQPHAAWVTPPRIPRSRPSRATLATRPRFPLPLHGRRARPTRDERQRRSRARPAACRLPTRTPHAAVALRDFARLRRQLCVPPTRRDGEPSRPLGRAGTSRRRGSGWHAIAPRDRPGRTRRSGTGAGAGSDAGRRDRRGPPPLRGEPLAALGAPPLQHGAPAPRAHPRPESVRAGALALLGLIGALHRRSRV